MISVTSIQLCTYTPVPGSLTAEGTRDLRLEIANTNADPSKSYILAGATGLDAEEILTQALSTGANDYYSMRPRSRTITLLIKLNPQYRLGETFADLRDAVYRAIMPDRNGELELRLMNKIIGIGSVFGRITKVEATTFTDDPAVQITFEAKYAFFRRTVYYDLSPPAITRVLDTSMSAWVYPFIDTESTAPHGYVMKWTATTDAGGFVLDYAVMLDADTIDYRFAHFEITYSFLTGDKIYISSEDDNKYVIVGRLFDAGGGLFIENKTNITDKVVSGSVWPLMFPNEMNYLVTYNAPTLNVLNYRVYYWGV